MVLSPAVIIIRKRAGACRGGEAARLSTTLSCRFGQQAMSDLNADVEPQSAPSEWSAIRKFAAVASNDLFQLRFAGMAHISSTRPRFERTATRSSPADP